MSKNKDKDASTVEMFDHGLGRIDAIMQYITKETNERNKARVV
jgi:hypothetical protein